MCGRFSLDTNHQRLNEHFGLSESPLLVARYNIAPSQSIPVVRMASGHRELVMVRWGLLPSWAKDKKIAYSTINARADTVASKPAFRTAFRQRRCLIPATGFYEWAQAGRTKQPYHIRMRDGDVFALAGLWEHWEGDAGEVIESCTIIVTDANECIQPVHDRMPVILNPAEYPSWLDPSHQDKDGLIPLLKPYPANRMTLYPVSQRVNSPSNDDAACVAPIA